MHVKKFNILQNLTSSTPYKYKTSIKFQNLTSYTTRQVNKNYKASHKIFTSQIILG